MHQDRDWIQKLLKSIHQTFQAGALSVLPMNSCDIPTNGRQLQIRKAHDEKYLKCTI